VASLIGNSRKIQLKPGWEEPAILWTATVAESGSMKSPPFHLVLRTLRAAQVGFTRKFNEDFQVYERDKKAWEKKGEGNPPRRPTAEYSGCVSRYRRTVPRDLDVGPGISRDRWERELILLLAGPMAGRAAGGRLPTWHGPGTDFAQALDLALRASPFGAGQQFPPPPVGSKPGMADERTTLDEGAVTLTYPDSLSPESVTEFEYWIEGVKRRLRRKAGVKTSTAPDQTADEVRRRNAASNSGSAP
jgi:hypothetical protein